MGSEYYDLNSKKIQLWASLSMSFIFLFIGIPIWWKTTEVYRADLPYSKIAELTINQQMQVTLTIALKSPTLSQQEGEHLAEELLLLLSLSEHKLAFVKVDYKVAFNPAVVSKDDFMIELQHSAVDKNEFEFANRRLICRCKTIEANNLKSVLKIVSDFVKLNCVQQEKLDDLVHNIHAKLDKISNLVSISIKNIRLGLQEVPVI